MKYVIIVSTKSLEDYSICKKLWVYTSIILFNTLDVVYLT